MVAKAESRVERNLRGWLVGWFRVRKANLERWLYTLHRLSGVVVGLYLIAHVVETSNALYGPDLWEGLMAVLKNPLAHLGLLIIAAGSVYHSFNGVRLVLAAYGKGIGRPVRPEYPYTPVSLTGWQRKLAWLTLAATFVLSAYAFYHLFVISLWGWG
jgi:succinate dehydrogenase / fumarate reductase cytochrome b subunit